jgi:hypothetical protein
LGLFLRFLLSALVSQHHEESKKKTYERRKSFSSLSLACRSLHDYRASEHICTIPITICNFIIIFSAPLFFASLRDWDLNAHRPKFLALHIKKLVYIFSFFFFCAKKKLMLCTTLWKFFHNCFGIQSSRNL